MAKAGDVRVVRVDSLNFAVEKLELIDGAKAGVNKGKLMWKNVGYYGNNLRSALKASLIHGADPNETKTFLKALEDAEKRIDQAIDRLMKNPELATTSIEENQIEGEEAVAKAGRGRKKKGS